MELLEVILAMYITSILDIATLNTINFSHNAIGDRGITLLYQNFQWCHASLSIWQCGFSVEGAESVAKILESNMTLKTLEIRTWESHWQRWNNYNQQDTSKKQSS